MKVEKIITLCLGLIVIGLPQLYADCCGSTEYDPSSQGCCNGALYDLATEVCCDGQPVENGKCCNGKRLEAWEECCRKVRPEQSYDPDFSCCEDVGLISKSLPIANLADCPHRVALEGYTPSLHVNGCGSTYSHYIIPNSFPPGSGIVDFEGSCNMHDLCYGRCNSESGAREGCDNLLRLNMDTDCDNQIPRDIQIMFPEVIGLCQGQAALYYNVLSGTGLSFGEGAWDDSQKEGCQCCP